MTMVEYSRGRVILPLGVIPKLGKMSPRANIPGVVLSHPVEYTLGQAGTRRTG